MTTPWRKNPWHESARCAAAAAARLAAAAAFATAIAVGGAAADGGSPIGGRGQGGDGGGPAVTTTTAPGGLPEPLRGVGFDQRLGEQLPLLLRFRDEEGREVALADYFGQRPVILSLVYFDCPMLCTLVLNGVAGAIKALPFEPGEDFDLLTVSFDPHDTPPLAAAKKRNYIDNYGLERATGAWHFLTGEAGAIQALTEAVGFRYTYDPETGQFAHASGIMLLTPSGKLARYFFGVDYSPRDLRLGLVEASANRIGTVVDQVLLYCFQYHPESGTYAASALVFIRLGGLLTVLLIILYVVRTVRRDRRRTDAASTGAAR